MKQRHDGLCLAASLALVVVGFVMIFGWPPLQRGQAQRPRVEPAPGQGRVVVQPTARLTPFANPVTVPPRLTPPPVPGHHWRWHRTLGWLALPVGVAPAAVVLPANYALPQQVQVYQAPAVAAPCQITCPFCGHPLTVEVR